MVIFLSSLVIYVDAAAANTNWFFDIFSWEHLMAVSTVFALLTTTAIVPVWHMFRKRKEQRDKEQDEKDTEKIRKISSEILNPIADKLNQHDDVLKDMKISAKQNDKNTIDTLNTLRTLVSEFHNYKDNQHKVNARLYFLEGAYNNNAPPPGNIKGYRDWRTMKRENQFFEEDTNNNPDHDKLI